MKRSGRLERHTPLRSSGRIAPKPRSTAERQRIYGTSAHIEWMQAHGCLCCGRTPCEVAHVKNGGLGRKASARMTVPLYPPCHREQHQIGTKAFERLHADMLLGRTLESWAATYAEAWAKWEAAR